MPPLYSWCLHHVLGASIMLLILPWCHLYWWLHFALGTSLVPPLWVPPLCSWYFLGASFMLWVPPLCSWYFPDASIMLLVPLLVHGPFLMFLDPPLPPPSPHVLGIPVCSSTSRYDFGLPSVLEEKRRKKRPPPPPHPHPTPTPPTHNHYINSYITEPNKSLQHFCTNNNG